MKTTAKKPRARRTPAPAPPRLAVSVNMAMTADGKIATANRAVSSFGSPRDKAHLLELRARADAVLCGARTADLNDIHLGPGGKKYRALRLRRGLAEYNLRVLVSRSGTVDPSAAIFKRRFSPIIVLTTSQAAPRLERLRRVADHVRICGRREINFRAAFAWLCRNYGVRRLHCEGGGELNGELFRQGLVDELHLTVCPRVFGGRNAPTIADGVGVDDLAKAFQLELSSTRRVGDEMFLVYRRSTPRKPNL